MGQKLSCLSVSRCIEHYKEEVVVEDEKKEEMKEEKEVMKEKEEKKEKKEKEKEEEEKKEKEEEKKEKEEEEVKDRKNVVNEMVIGLLLVSITLLTFRLLNV